MKWPRVSILGLIAAVVACGVAFAALRGGSAYWIAAFYTMTVAFLLVAVVLAHYRRGASRAFWFGFAVFGWGMFIIGANPWQLGFEQDYGIQPNPNMLTTKLITWVVVRIRMGTDDLDQVDAITSNTISIVHFWSVLAIATLGGLFSILMKKRAGRPPAGDSSRRSNAGPSTIILVGLSLAGLGTLARPGRADIPAYFPEDAFPEAARHPDGIIARYRIQWYSYHLRAAGEPSLWWLSRRDREATAFRFLWLPAFDHPVCVRIDRAKVGAKLRAVVLDGREGREGSVNQGQVVIDRTVELTEVEWREFERLVESAKFWRNPAIHTAESAHSGDQCVIEGVKAGVYHVALRWSPDPALTALCKSMLDLSGLKTQKTWDKYHHD
jgi:hypothetical protein